MNLASILTLILQNPQAVESTIGGLINMFKATTALTVSTTTDGTTSTKAPSAAIKELQTVLNAVMKPQPPLVVDGWLGPKTEKAIHDALVMAKPYLAMLS